MLLLLIWTSTPFSCLLGMSGLLITLLGRLLGKLFFNCYLLLLANYFSIAIWHIWSYRNNDVFNLKMENNSSFYNKFWADYTFTNNILYSNDPAIRDGSSAVRIWAPPQNSYFKLNTDGSWLDINNDGGGGVIRCSKGL